MIRSSLILLLLLQDREAILKRDLERIKSRPAPTEKASSVAELPEWKPKESIGKFHLMAIPVGFDDDAGEEKPKVFESLAAYVKENGLADFKITIAPRVKLSQVRAQLSKHRMGSEEEGAWITGLLEKLDLKEVDGVCIAYAGILEPGKNSMFWPHQTSIAVRKEERRYYIAPQRGGAAPSIHAHEFMHLFGLKDKYDSKTPHCILAYGYEPLRVCASCRMTLGWAKTARVTTEAATRVRLADFTKSPECVRVDLISGGSEYLVLELRGQSILVWHTIGATTVLYTQLDGVKSDRLTPHSEPKFRPKSIGSRAVFLTDVRIDNGQATLKISGDEPLTELEQDNLSRVGRIINPK